MPTTITTTTTTTTTTKIPVVDLGELNVSIEKEPSGTEWERVGRQISAAFSDIGFVYLTNHGVPQNQIRSVNDISDVFFQLDPATKMKYKRGAKIIQGYTAPDQERLSSDGGTYEVRESYDVTCVDGMLPHQEVPALAPALTTLTTHCHALTTRVLTAIALGLGLDRTYFTSRHTKMRDLDNATCMRLLYYPSLPAHVPPGTTRTATHTDYGTITLLFQDEVGGLEVRDRSGAWVSAKPLPGTVLVNVGDILQFWTADKFRATEHRVLIPEEEKRRKVARRSLVFFVHPDESVMIGPLDGSSAYTPISAKEHTQKRFAQTYQY